MLEIERRTQDTERNSVSGVCVCQDTDSGNIVLSIKKSTEAFQTAKRRGRRIEEKEEYIVKRSEIETDEEGNIVWAGDPLSQYLGNVVRKRIRKRYVVIEKELFGKKRTVLLSIRLKGEE